MSGKINNKPIKSKQNPTLPEKGGVRNSQASQEQEVNTSKLKTGSKPIDNLGKLDAKKNVTEANPKDQTKTEDNLKKLDAGQMFDEPRKGISKLKGLLKKHKGINKLKSLLKKRKTKKQGINKLKGLLRKKKVTSKNSEIDSKGTNKLKGLLKKTNKGKSINKLKGMLQKKKTANTDAAPKGTSKLRGFLKKKSTNQAPKEISTKELVQSINNLLAKQNTNLKQIYLDSQFDVGQFNSSLQKLIKDPALLKQINSKLSDLYNAASISESDRKAQIVKQEIKADIKESEEKQVELANQSHEILQEEHNNTVAYTTYTYAAETKTKITAANANNMSVDELMSTINKTMNSINNNANLSADQKKELRDAFIADLRSRGFDDVLKKNIKGKYLDAITDKEGKILNDADYEKLADTWEKLFFEALEKGDKKRAQELLSYAQSNSPEAKKFFEELAITQGLIKIAESKEHAGKFDTLGGYAEDALINPKKFASLIKSLDQISATEIPEDALTRVLKEAFKIDQKELEASAKAQQAEATAEKIITEKKQEIERVNRLVENSIKDYIASVFGSAYANNPILISIMKYKGYIEGSDYIAAFGWEQMIRDPRFKDTIQELAKNQPEALKDYILERIGRDDKQKITAALKWVFKIDSNGSIVDKIYPSRESNVLKLKETLASSWFLADPENKKDSPNSQTKPIKSSSPEVIDKFLRNPRKNGDDNNGNLGPA